MPSLKVIVSGGGTGGHIFPAIAIANAIKTKKPDAEFLFVGANGKMEMEKVPAAGYKIVGLNIAGFQRSLSLKNLSFPFKLIGSMIKARKIVKSFKPDVAIGTGGFASGPTLRAASAMGVPALIQEQNSLAGVTNRILGQKVQKICVAYEGMDKFFDASKIILTGNPVRKQMVAIEGKRDTALAHFNLDSSKPTVLVVGGSLGAQSINKAILKGLDELALANVQLIWQTGKPGYAAAEKAVEPFIKNGIQAHQFIYEMDMAYAAADVVISRAGAIAVSELCLVQKPTILVPYPHAAEDHQTKNALALVNKNAAIHIADSEVSTKLLETLLEVVKNQDEQEKLIRNIQELGISDAAERIAEEVIRLAE